MPRLGCKGAKDTMELDITSEREGDVCVLSLSGEVDVYTAPGSRRSLSKRSRPDARKIVVDLDDVGFMDSSGLGVLVGGLRRVKERDGSDTARVRPREHPQGLPHHRAGQGVPVFSDTRRGSGVLDSACPPCLGRNRLQSTYPGVRSEDVVSIGSVCRCSVSVASSW